MRLNKGMEQFQVRNTGTNDGTVQTSPDVLQQMISRFKIFQVTLIHVKSYDLPTTLTCFGVTWECLRLGVICFSGLSRGPGDFCAYGAQQLRLPRFLQVIASQVVNAGHLLLTPVLDLLLSLKLSFEQKISKNIQGFGRFGTNLSWHCCISGVCIVLLGQFHSNEWPWSFRELSTSIRVVANSAACGLVFFGPWQRCYYEGVGWGVGVG